MKGQCLYCNNPLKGRLDKKYCDDLCRSAYNNDLRRKNNRIINQINSILNKNRNIIKNNLSAKDNKQEYCTPTYLIQQGFNFEYFTHIKQDSTGHIFRFCYDMGLCKTEDGRVILRSDPKGPLENE